MITLELLGSTITSSAGTLVDAGEDLEGARVERRAALHHVGAELLVEAAHAGARGDGHDSAAHRGPVHRRRAVVAQPRGALVLLLVHVGDVEPLDRPAAGEDGDRALGLVGVNVHAQRARVADDEHRIADLLERAARTSRASRLSPLTMKLVQ